VKVLWRLVEVSAPAGSEAVVLVLHGGASRTVRRGVRRGRDGAGRKAGR